jgi:hypothetical protein
LEQAAIGMTKALLRESGMLHPPIVHVLAEELDPPYAGSDLPAVLPRP